MGNTASAAGRLWDARDARELGAGDFEGKGHFEMEAGYGFGFGPGRSTLTPYAGTTFGEETARTVRTGARWEIGPDIALGLEASRHEYAGEASGDVMLSAAVRF